MQRIYGRLGGLDSVKRATHLAGRVDRQDFWATTDCILTTMCNDCELLKAGGGL